MCECECACVCVFLIIIQNATALGKRRRVGGFVLRQFIEHQSYQLNECQEYKITYVEPAFTRPMLFFPSNFQLFPMCPLTLNEPVTFVHYTLTPFFHCTFTGGPPGPEHTTNICDRACINHPYDIKF